MQKPPYIPQDYKRILVVNSLEELFDAEFGGPEQINCILLPRRLTHDFNTLAREFDRRSGFGEQRLRAIAEDLSCPEVIRAAAKAIQNDISVLGQEAAKRNIRFPYGFRKGVQLTGPAPDKGNYVLHGDGVFTAAFGRLLVGYTEGMTEWARNEDVVMRSYPGRPVTNHFTLKAGGRTYKFQPGDIWRQAGMEKPGGAPPFVHRASHEIRPDLPSRLLLVAA